MPLRFLSCFNFFSPFARKINNRKSFSYQSNKIRRFFFFQLKRLCACLIRLFFAFYSFCCFSFSVHLPEFVRSQFLLFFHSILLSFSSLHSFSFLSCFLFYSFILFILLYFLFFLIFLISFFLSSFLLAVTFMFLLPFSFLRPFHSPSFTLISYFLLLFYSLSFLLIFLLH